MKEFVVFLVMMLSHPIFASEPELIGGKIIDKGEHPEIIYIRSGHAYCSATIIGPETILTAAHCVKDMGEIVPTGFDFVDFFLGSEIFHAKCRQTPQYRVGIDLDFALCKTDKPMDIEPASVSKQAPILGEIVTLSGYGCEDSDGNGGNNGTLKMGQAKVTRLPRQSNYWFYTEDDSALCYGDSGGPSLLGDGSSKEVIGVNSQGDIKRVSLLTAMYLPQSIEFMKQFATEQNVSICGVTEDC